MRWIVLKKKEGYFQQSNGQLAIQSLLKIPSENQAGLNVVKQYLDTYLY